MTWTGRSVAGGFAGGAAVPDALEPAVTDSNRLDKNEVYFVDGIAMHLRAATVSGGTPRSNPTRSGFH
jgi:hypothetical protein